MMLRIEVVPVLKLGWLVYYGTEGSATFHKKKGQAVRTARSFAKFYKLASIRIHKRNGQFQEERTYPRSKDPKRSPG